LIILFLGFAAETVDLEEFDKTVIANTQNAIFLVATYGEGEPTDNAAKFFAWIKDDKKEMAPGALSNLGFSVFGLGNKQYEHYNR
jgi:NADPH-ferrihemoprotein reductase